MTFWRFCGAVIAALLIVGWVNHLSPHYFVLVFLAVGSVGGLISFGLFLRR